MGRPRKPQEKAQQPKAQPDVPRVKKVIQRLVRRDNVVRYQEQGWKIVPAKPGIFQDQFSDTMLMEK